MKLLIFDLDGTLIDSADDIAHSVNEVRERLSLPELPLEDIEGFIGNGVRKLLERALLDTEPSLVERAHELYLPIYRRRLLDHTRAYPGVDAALHALAAPGRTLSVLTNKPRRESVMILDGLGLLDHFDAVYGGDSFAHRKPNPIGVRHLMDEARATTAETLFVGDSAVDLETARSASVPCCLVTYGIRPDRLSRLEPDFRVDDLRELTNIVGTAA